MRGRTRRAAVMLAAPACLAAWAVIGCSFLTNLDGLAGDDASASVLPADAPGSETTTTETSTSDARSDGPPVVPGAYAPRFERSFAIMNPSTTPLAAGYTVCFRAVPQDILGPGTATKLRADAGDLRLFSSGVEVKRVVDNLRTGIVSVCFRLAGAIGPGATDTSYVIRYGDAAAAPPPPAESDVFDFFDGFDGTSLSPRWLQFGAPVVAGGFVTFPKNAPSAITTISGPDGVPLDASLEINARVANPASDGQLQDDAGTRFFYWFGFQHQGDFVAAEPWSIFIARGKSTVNAEHKTASGTCVSGCDEAAGAQTTDARVYKVDRAGETVVFTYDTGATFQAVGSSGDQSLMLRNYLLASDVVVDWVRARPLVLPEPIPSVGPEVVLGN